LDRRYDHNFPAIFDNFQQKKLAFFSKTNVMTTFSAKIAFCLTQKWRFFRQTVLRIKKMTAGHYRPSNPISVSGGHDANRCVPAKTVRAANQIRSFQS
jgi:hypothetical protein